MNLARTLVTDGQEVSIIEKSGRRVREMGPEIDALMIEGNGASPRMLRELDVGGFDLVAAVTTVDEVNVIAALIAKQAGVETVVARVRDPEYFDGDGGGQTELTGIQLAPELPLEEVFFLTLLCYMTMNVFVAVSRGVSKYVAKAVPK